LPHDGQRLMSPVSLLLQRRLPMVASAITAEVRAARVAATPARTLEGGGGLKGLVHAVNVTDGSRA